MTKSQTIMGGAALVAMMVLGSGEQLSGQSGTALTGTVTSQQEGEMEGVLVTADGARRTSM